MLTGGNFRRRFSITKSLWRSREELGDVRGEGITLDNLGNVCADSGQYSKAVEYYEKSLAIFRKLGDLGGQGDTVNNLGNIYNGLGSVL